MEFTRRKALFVPLAPAIIGLAANPVLAQMLTTGAGKKPGGAVSRTTLFTWNDFTAGGGFTDSAGTVVSNNQTDPLSGSTASTYTADGTTAVHKVARTMSITASAVTVFSIYAKQGTDVRFALREDQQTGSGSIFDISTGSVVANLVGGTGTITAQGSSWYLCETQFTAAGSTFAGFRMSILLNTAVDLNNESNNSSATIFLYTAKVQTIP